MEMNSELAFDTGGPREFPADGLPEVAVLGRSNVGKSTLINTLVGRRNLARTSSTPGKTRRIYFYRVESASYLVDLPGFGYASVGRAERDSWRPMVESYLRGDRAELRGAIVLIDLRRGPRDEEYSLLEWLASEQIDTRVAWTKSDKLKRGEVARQAEAYARDAGLPAQNAAAVSAKTGAGVGAVAEWLRAWTGVAYLRADGGAFRV